MPWHRTSIGVARSGLWAPDQYTYNHIPTYTSGYCKSSVDPPPGWGLFISNQFDGGGASLRRGGLFDLEKTMVSVLHKKKTRIQRGKAQVQEVRGYAAEDQNRSELPVGK